MPIADWRAHRSGAPEVWNADNEGVVALEQSNRPDYPSGAHTFVTTSSSTYLADRLLESIERAVAEYRDRYRAPVTWNADTRVGISVELDEVPANAPRTVFAFNVERRTNADLILDAHRLKYLRNDDVIFDATYGRGVMWQRWRPLRGALIANDLWTEAACGLHHDFRWLVGCPTENFDAVVFDPPYKLNGTPAMGGMDERYGVASYTRWQDRYALIEDGLVECARVCKRHLLVKCMDQVVSGKVRWQTIDFTNHVHAYTGMRLVDQLHLPGMREQPAGRRQVHARRNYSTLLVFAREAPDDVGRASYVPRFTRHRTNDGAWCVTNQVTGAQEFTVSFSDGGIGMTDDE